MNRLDHLGAERRTNLIRWCLMRQNQGYNGRTNKDNDSCYSFWIGATLNLLGVRKATYQATWRNLNCYCLGIYIISYHIMYMLWDSPCLFFWVYAGILIACCVCVGVRYDTHPLHPGVPPGAVPAQAAGRICQDAWCSSGHLAYILLSVLAVHGTSESSTSRVAPLIHDDCSPA